MKKTVCALLIVAMCTMLLVTPVVAAPKLDPNCMEQFIVRSSFISVDRGGTDDVGGHLCQLRVDAGLRIDLTHWWGTGVFIDVTGRLRAVLNITRGERQGEHASWILTGGTSDENGPHGGGATVWLDNVKIAENVVFGLQLDTIRQSYYLELYSPVDRAYRWSNYNGQIFELTDPNFITIIVKYANGDPLTSPFALQIFDSRILGEPNWLYSGSTDSSGKLVLVNGVDVNLVPGRTYLVVMTDFETIGDFKVNRGTGNHVTVYAPEWYGP